MQLTYSRGGLLVMLLLCHSALGQRRFEIKDASKAYNVQIKVADCQNKICEGPATFTLSKKGERRPFQIFDLANTSFLLRDDETPSVNKTMLYDEQSVINFGDYNFDGIEDLALCDGTEGGYGMPSYRIYLFSRQQNRFVFNAGFTRLVHGTNLGMFEVDAKKRTLQTFAKSGCCYHVTNEFAVVANRPKKILEIVEDATIPNENKIKVTTRRLVKNKWRLSVKYEPRASQ